MVKFMKKVFAIALCAMFVVVAATAQKKSAPAQLRSMYMDDLFDDEGRLDTAKCRELIPNGIGHFSQFCMQQPRDPNELRDRAAAVQDWLIHHTPNGSPALLHEEVLSGINTLGSTIYPQQIGQACSFNPASVDFRLQQQVMLTGHAVSKPIRNLYFSGSVVSDKTNAKQ